MTDSSALDLIGTTPVVRIQRFDTGPCELYVKLESQNPGGSIKDRIGRSMIEAAERDGKLGPHQPRPGLRRRNVCRSGSLVDASKYTFTVLSSASVISTISTGRFSHRSEPIE